MLRLKLKYLIALWLLLPVPVATTTPQSRIFSREVLTNIRTISGVPTHRSAEGREIPVFRVNSKGKNVQAAAQHFYVQGGLHGNEKLTSTFVMWLANRFNNGESTLNQLNASSIQIDFVPAANPDGLRQASRYNAAQVNLNRNFGVLWGLSREYPGSSEFSESETTAIRWMLNNGSYTAAVDVHGYINWIVAPSSPSAIKSATPERATLHNSMVANMNKELHRLPFADYEVKTAAALGDGGAFEDYAFWGANVYAFCLEMGFRDRFYKTKGQAIARRSSGDEQIDSFLQYESFIHAMFSHAIDAMPSSNGTVAKN
jgi:hypothetical protein